MQAQTHIHTYAIYQIISQYTYSAVIIPCYCGEGRILEIMEVTTQSAVSCSLPNCCFVANEASQTVKITRAIH